jgi:hypothetical protein
MFPNNQLNQMCVYWGSPVNDGYGSYTYSDPIELKCRWIEGTELIRNSEGNEIVSTTQVVVSQDVEENGYLYLGSLDDLDSDEGDNPKLVDSAFPIIKFHKTPTLKGNVFYREVYL